MAISRVTYRFLDGNLIDGLTNPVTDEQQDEIGNAYAAAVESALQREFPGAEISVEHERRTSGSVPGHAIDVESDAKDIYVEHREVEDAEFAVQRIAEDAWDQSDEWWPVDA